jgi:geranylgeranyl pyrophosphate synthase
LELKDIYRPIEEDLKQVSAKFEQFAEEYRQEFPQLNVMLEHTLVGGKIIRPAMVFLAGKCFDYNREQLLKLAVASELLHIATLVHDDAIDKSDTRRGRETVNKLWGTDKAVLLGDFLFAHAGVVASATESTRIVKLFSNTLKRLSGAELDQSYNAYNTEQTYQQYIKRIGGKTASLMSMTSEGGAILGGASQDGISALKDYGYNLGLAFQIIDDILDFTGSEQAMGKPVGSDLAQGTLTLPAMMLIQRKPQDDTIVRIFKGEDKENNIKRAVEMINESSIIEDCYAKAVSFSEEAYSSLNKIPVNENRQNLKELAEFLIMRNK